MTNYHDGCFPLFELGDDYKRGLLAYERTRNKLKGRVACHRESVGVICAVAAACTGDHLEIGTLFGGTTIATLLVKQSGKVVCVDPLDGYYGLQTDPLAKLTPSVEILEENLKTFNLQDRVIIVPGYSPAAIPPGLQFDTCLIDGDHTEAGARADWMAVKDIVNKYVIFDNIDDKHPGVVKVFQEACATPGWRPVLIFDIEGVVERC